MDCVWKSKICKFSPTYYIISLALRWNYSVIICFVVFIYGRNEIFVSKSSIGFELSSYGIESISPWVSVVDIFILGYLFEWIIMLIRCGCEVNFLPSSHRILVYSQSFLLSLDGLGRQWIIIFAVVILIFALIFPNLTSPHFKMRFICIFFNPLILIITHLERPKRLETSFIIIPMCMSILKMMDISHIGEVFLINMFICL